MNILVVEPGKRPYAKEISGELESLKQTVGGYIQAIYPFDDPVVLVCEEDDFTDLPQELTEKYTEFFRQAYDFVLVCNILMPIPLGE